MVAAEFQVGGPAPDIQAQDIEGNPVNLQQVLDESPDLVVLFFFSVETGEEIALKLQVLNRLYGKDDLKVIALGLEDEKDALVGFAEDLGIKYFIIPKEETQAASWRGDVESLPVTLFLVTHDRTIERVIRGGTGTQAKILVYAAENFFQQRNMEAANAIVDAAIQAGEDESSARELKGFVLVAEGKLDAAEAEFGQIDSNTGLAKVALEKGDLDKAVSLADSAGEDGYAQTVKGQAQMRSGKMDEAAATLKAAEQKDARGWQQSENLNAQGRVKHEQGNTDAAIGQYKQAVALDPYNVIALSNEGAAHRSIGNLEEANATLERASRIRDDDMVMIMMQQIQREMKEGNDVKRAELIRSQIADLKTRFNEIKVSGVAETMDDWSTRPIILAFLPSQAGAPVFFERAGTDVVLQREIEARLMNDKRVSIVERSMLDKLLQELNLGSSELASKDTQRRLGKVLSAGLLGFIDFAQLGRDNVMYLRLVDTETTGITFQTSHAIDAMHPGLVVDAMVEALLKEVANGSELKGLIADASAEEAIMINLGEKHGVKMGQTFNVIEDGDAIEVGGRVIAYKQKIVGKITVTTLEQDYAICKATNVREGITLTKAMKIKAAR
jgi:tetratricopeptide (TPR) repeat protein